MGTVSSAGGDFLRFLLCLSGVTLLVAAQFNLPRRDTIHQLEKRHSQFAGELASLQHETGRLRGLARAFEDDPHYRKVVLRWALGHRPPGARTVEEYVRDPEGLGPFGRASSAQVE